MKILNQSQYQINQDIILRLCQLEDAEALFSLIDNNREYLKTWLGWLDFTQSVDDSRGFIRKTICDYMVGKAVAFGIFYRDELVGMCSVTEMIGDANLGYWLAEDKQGQGIMTTCAEYLTKLALIEMGCHRVVIRCAVGNAKSRAIPERLGYTQEGVARQQECLNGKYLDLVIYSFIKPDLKCNEVPCPA